MLNLQNINKTFHTDGSSVRVLTDISLRLGRGEFLCILGKSGSGKSTLLNIMSTLLIPDSGQIFYNSRDITGISSKEINRIRQHEFSVVFQSLQLFPYLTAMENVLLPYMHGLRPVGRDAKKNAQEMLERVGLKGKEKRLPGKLSGGEQQRVAIARALIKKPSIIFADEPTGSLDTATGKDIIDLLKELNGGGISVVMVTHSKEYAEAGHTILNMQDGIIRDIEKNCGAC